MMRNLGHNNYSAEETNNSLLHETRNFKKTEYYTDQPHYTMARLIWIIISPVIILMGVVGNILVVLIFQRPNFRKSSAALILRSLAITDSAMLLLSCFPRLVAFVLKVDLHEIYDGTCRGEYFTTYFLTDLTAWVLVLITLERAVAVVLPLKSKTIITRRVTMMTLAVITLSFLALNLPIPFLLHLTDDGVCEPYPQYKLIWERVMGSVNLTISSFIPFTLISVINFIGWMTLLMNERRCEEFRVTSSQSGERWKLSSVTRMLVAIDLVFLATTMPIALFRVFFPDSMYHPEPEFRAKLILYRAICELILYCNSCANFYLYCLAGLRFRNELKRMFGFRQPADGIRLEFNLGRYRQQNFRIHSSSSYQGGTSDNE